MTLYKTVAKEDGTSEQVEMSADEEAAIRAEWTANDPAKIKLAWRPLQIVHALEIMGVAAALADGVDKVTWTKFCCAETVSESDPLLLAALQSIGKTIADLKAVIV